MKLCSRLTMITCVSMLSTLPPCPESDLHSAISQMEAMTGQQTRQQQQAQDKANQPCNPCGAYSATVMPESRLTGEKQIITTIGDSVSSSASMRPVAMWTSKDPSKVGIVFTGSHRDWKYLKCNNVAILMDGKIVEIEKQQHDGKVLPGSGYVHETIVTVIDVEHISGILGMAGMGSKIGSKMEYKICNDEFEADQRFVCELRSLIEKAGN